MSTTDGNPQSARGQRRLAAVMIADIVKYSHLMGLDEEGTLARMKRHRREIIDPTIAEHHGRIVNAPGDSLLAVFDSPLEAVRCALVIQQSISARYTALPKAQWMQYRIGVNLGDIIVDPEDHSVYGDGVNIAARLQASAEPGGVNISGGVYEQIKNKLVCGYQSLGDEKLKNITDPVRIYRVLPDLAAVSRVRRASNRVLLGAVAGCILIGAIGWYGWREFDAHGWGRTGAQVSSAPVIQEPARAQPKEPAPVAEPAREILSLPAPIPAERPPVILDTASDKDLARKEIAVAIPRAAPAVPDTGPYPRSRDCPYCPELISLPGGSFTMGSNEDPSEKPIRTVTLKPFAIGRFPVTVAEWKECVAARACSLEPSGPNEAPVRNLSWNDARDYVIWISKVASKEYRLPSEAEWEYAARGATQTRFWWGNQVEKDMANCKDCSEVYDQQPPQKVGNFSGNPFGLYDTAGIVKEWVSDCWHRNYQGAPRDGRSWEEPTCIQRVLRGGSWRTSSDEIRPASRAAYDVGVRYPTHGLRVARSLN